MRKLSISFALMLWASVAMAYAPQTMYTCGSGTGWFADAGSACSAYVAYANSINTTSEYTGARVSGSSCQADGKFRSGPNAGKYSGTLNVGISSASRCSDGSAPTNGQCSVAPTDPPKTCNTPAGQPVSWWQKTGHSADPNAEQADGSGMPGGYPTSSPTCGVTGRPSTEECRGSPAADGGQDFYCKFSGTSNGQGAPAASAPTDSGAPPSGSEPTNMPPTKADSGGNCPGGSTQGGIDSGGTPICVGSGTNPTGSNGGAPTDAKPTSSTTTKTTDASGNKVTTTTGTRDNGDGSKTTTKTVETEAPDGSKSSSTTTTTGLTPGGKQGQPDKPDDDFCRQHPELNMCRNSSVAGQCGQISCNGDAIQCATLREAATIQCRQKEAEDAIKASSQYTLGNAAANGNDPEKDSLPSPGNGQTVDISALSADGWLGGGSAFDDVSFTLQGHTITVPLDKVSSFLLALRYALMVAASLVSFRILSGAVFGS